MSEFNPEDLKQFSQFPSILLGKLDVEGRILAINDEVENILGWKAEEMCGHLIKEFLAPITPQMFSFEPLFHQYLFQHKNKSTVTITIIPRKSGDVFYFMGRQNKKDTDNSSEMRLKLTSERLSLAVKMSEVGIFEWWPDTNAVIQDETIDRIYGFEPGEMSTIPDAYAKYIHPDDQAGVNAGVLKCVADFVQFSNEHRIIRKDGQVRWVKCWIRPIREEDTSIRVIGTMMDITDQKEASEEQRLLAQITEIISSSFDYSGNLQKVLKLLVETRCDSAFIEHIDEEHQMTERFVAKRNAKTGLIEVTSHSYKNAPSIPDHPVIQKIFSGEVVHIEDLASLNEEVKAYYTPEFLSNVIIPEAKELLMTVIQRHNQTIGSIGLNFHHGNKRAFVQRDFRFLREVSYRISMAMENSLLFLSSQNAVRARDEFLSIASHELKNPLQSLTLQNGILTRHLNKTHEGNGSMTIVKKSLESDRRQLLRLSRLIEDMLDITRIQNSKMRIEKENFDFSVLLEEVVERMLPAFEVEGVKLTYEKPLTSLFLNADSFRIEQVLINLLTNALKYGRLSPVEIQVWEESGKIKFTVTDQGPGISEEDQRRLFQRFERAGSRSEASGLGLGLYICKKIVDAHNGSIRVDSRPGKGSSFTVTLPLD